MNAAQAKLLANKGFIGKNPLHGELIETHISWIILSGSRVFKIKKPVKLPFLNYSTIRLRKKMCEKELQLNKRTTGIYQAVLPIRISDGSYVIGGKKGKIVDHTVQMRRISESLRLDHLLKRNKITIKDVRILARTLATFHNRSPVIKRKFDIRKAKSLFNEILSYRSVIKSSLGPKYCAIIDETVRWSDSFLEQHAADFKRRTDHGFVRDVHGDLHAANIFMEKSPVIFDCIEFNDKFRQIDVLYEIAFLAMDIEACGRPRLANELLKEYFLNFPCVAAENDSLLLNYLKCLRANVRAQVHLISVKQNRSDITSHIKQSRKYVGLMRSYMNSHVNSNPIGF